MAQETQYTSYPEVVDHRVYWHQPEVARNLYAVPDSTLEYAGKAAEKEIVIGPLLQTRPTKPVWYQRHWLLALLGVGIVVIGIAIGCGVGLTRRNAAAGGEPSAGPSSSASPFPSPGANKSETSACHQTICQQVLSALASSEPDTLTVFGLGTDKSIWYRTGDGSAKWSSNWLSWGSSFVTGAAAAVVGNRSFALAVSETSKSVQARENKWGSWSLTTDLGGPVGAAPVVCARPDWSFLWVWSLDVASGGLPIQRWTNTTLGDLTPWGPEPFKQRVAARGTPGLACRRSTVFHDLAIYAKDNGGLLITHFNYTGGATGGVGVWADWDYLGGSFVGHPVLVTVDTTRFDFFGIGTDKQMYHLSWTEMAGNSRLEPLGGSFASVPSAFVSADKRIDIVALGTDGKLKHRSLVGTTWSPEWEDLGIFANSAPLLVETVGRPEKVSLFFVGERGEMQYASWTISPEANWKRVVTPKGIGGNFTGIPPL